MFVMGFVSTFQTLLNTLLEPKNTNNSYCSYNHLQQLHVLFSLIIPLHTKYWGGGGGRGQRGREGYTVFRDFA